MGLVERVCPLCSGEASTTVLSLSQAEFTETNSSYRMERLQELDLDPHQVYPIVECKDCGMVYSLYHLDDESEGIVYERIIDADRSKAKILTFGKRVQDLRRWMGFLDLGTASNDERLELKVADYGCGWGTFLMAASGPGVTVFGFDVTSWKVQWAREHGIRIVESEKELLGHAPYDVCNCTSVLEHLREPTKAVMALASLVRPGGYAFITGIVDCVAGPRGWNTMRRKVANGIPIPKEINPWEHLNYFTPDTFRRLLGQAGFSLVKSTPFVNSSTRTAQVRTVVKRLLRTESWLAAMGEGFWQLDAAQGK